MAGARRRVGPPLRLQPFDLARYVGSEERGIAPPYTPAELLVLGAGAVGLICALAARGPLSPRAAAHAVSKYNRRRFHARPKRD